MTTTFKREGNEIIQYRDGARITGVVGVVLDGNDESLQRVLLRVFELGRKDKAAEVRATLGL